MTIKIAVYVTAELQKQQNVNL